MRGELMPFEEVPLEKEQQDLLADMVEAERAVAPQDRQEFLLIGMMSGYLMHHPGLKRDEFTPGATGRGRDDAKIPPTFWAERRRSNWGCQLLHVTHEEHRGKLNLTSLLH